MTDGAFDLADIDFSQPPAKFVFEEDELPFDAADKDDNSDA